MLQVKSGAGWSTKDTMMTLHLGTGLWLLILSGGAMYVGGAISLLWVKLEALQHPARALPTTNTVSGRLSTSGPRRLLPTTDVRSVPIETSVVHLP